MARQHDSIESCPVVLRFCLTMSLWSPLLWCVPKAMQYGLDERVLHQLNLGQLVVLDQAGVGLQRFVLDLPICPAGVQVGSHLVATGVSIMLRNPRRSVLHLCFWMRVLSFWERHPFRLSWVISVSDVVTPATWCSLRLLPCSLGELWAALSLWVGGFAARDMAGFFGSVVGYLSLSPYQRLSLFVRPDFQAQAGHPLAPVADVLLGEVSLPWLEHCLGEQYV